MAKDHGAYIVVAVAWGDGETNAGRRVWSHEFRTRGQAEACMVWLQGLNVMCTIFDDFEED